MIEKNSEKEIENKNFMITLARGLGANIGYLNLEAKQNDYVDSFDDVL